MMGNRDCQCAGGVLAVTARLDGILILIRGAWERKRGEMTLQSGTPGKSLVIKRSIVIDGHKTSVSLEDAFWQELKRIAGHQRVTLSSVIGSIDMRRQRGNLSSAIRLYVLEQARARAEEAMLQRQGKGAAISVAG